MESHQTSRIYKDGLLAAEDTRTESDLNFILWAELWE